MDKLTLLAKEFQAIARHLQTAKACPGDATGSALYAQKSEVVKLLNKNPYMPATEKLIYWRSLGWLDCDTDRLTRRRYIAGRYQRVLVLNLHILDSLDSLLKPVDAPSGGRK